MNGTRARSAGVKRATPSPPEREVPKSWVKRGTSSGDKMEKVYDIVRWFRLREASRGYYFGLVPRSRGSSLYSTDLA